jgi:quinol monooxygenase YgiN
MEATMTDAQVTVTVLCKAKPGMEERLKRTLAALIAPSRAEDGSIDYFMHQSLDEPSKFLLYMSWRDEAAFSRHVATPYVQEFDDRLAHELLAEPYILTRWRHLG